DIAYKPRSLKVDAMTGCCAAQHARCRLATIAHMGIARQRRLGMMRTVVKIIQLRPDTGKHGAQMLSDNSHVFVAHPPQTDAGLVADDDQRQPQSGQPGEALCCTGCKSHASRLNVVRDIPQYGAVFIQEDGGFSRGPLCRW